MAKRFIDSNLFKKNFIRGLEAPDKLLFIYLFCDCNHAGIWEIDCQIASIYCGYNVNIELIKSKLKNKVIFLDNDTKLFIYSFIEFQYGKLSINNNAHKFVISELTKYGLINSDFELYEKQYIEGLTRGCQAPMDMDKDMDMDKEKDMLKNEILNLKKEIEKLKTEKKPKEKKEFIPPTELDVVDYFKENGYAEQAAKKAFKFYNTANWIDSHNNKVLNWKQKMIAVWFKDENKTNKQTPQQNSLFDKYPNLKLLSEKYPDGKYHPDSNRFVVGNMIFDCFSGKRVVV